MADRVIPPTADVGVVVVPSATLLLAGRIRLMREYGNELRGSAGWRQEEEEVVAALLPSSTSCTGARRERIADVVNEYPSVAAEELADEAEESAGAAGGSEDAPPSGEVKVTATSGVLGFGFGGRFRHCALLWRFKRSQRSFGGRAGRPIGAARGALILRLSSAQVSWLFTVEAALRGSRDSKKQIKMKVGKGGAEPGISSRAEGNLVGRQRSHAH